MTITLRAGTASDAEVCGHICYQAFASISNQHNFPPDFPSPEDAVGLLGALLGNREVYSVVAEVDGRVVGSNFMHEGSAIAGIGPITVDPEGQNASVGRKLMVDTLERAERRGFSGVRLVQAAYHNRSLSLYAKLGFVVREPLAVMQGTPPRRGVAGHRVRAAKAEDLDACVTLHHRVHGFSRRSELEQAIDAGTATVVEHDDRLTGYATLVGFFGHTCGETNDDLKALIAGAAAYPGPGFLLPSRNADMFAWCLNSGLKVVQPMTLMSLGLYNEPAGAFLPSVIF